MVKPLRKSHILAGMFFLTVFCTLPAMCQERQAAPAETEAEALRALIERAISGGEALPVPSAADAEAQEFVNAGRAGGRDVVESPKKLRPQKMGGIGRSNEDQKLAGGMTVVGMALGAHSDMMSQLPAAMPEQERAKMSGLATNLAGMPKDTPSKALRRSGSRATHVFYVLLGKDENGKANKPVRLVWRQTHGDKAAIASRSIYFITDADGTLLDVVERGKGYQGRARARLKNEDKDIAERFKLEKRFWLGKSKAAGPR